MVFVKGGARENRPPPGVEKSMLNFERDGNLNAESSRVRKKKGMGRCRVVLEVHSREPGGYGWTGQRKSADAFLVTVTVLAVCAARTAASDVRSTGVLSGLNVTRKTAQWPP